MQAMRILIWFLLSSLVPVVGSANTLEFDPEIPQALRVVIESDFQDLELMTGHCASPMFREIFQSSTYNGIAILNFIRKGTEKIVWDSHPRPYLLGATGMDIIFNPTSVIRFEKMGSLDRMMSYLHEGAHNNGAPKHIECPRPFKDKSGRDIVGRISKMPMAGLPACDDNYRGSYGIEFVAFKNIEFCCSNCSVSVRKDARELAKYSLQRVIGDDQKNLLVLDAKQVGQ